MKRELRKNWIEIRTIFCPERAELISRNLQRLGFETFILRHKTVKSLLRCTIYVSKKSMMKNNGKQL